MACDNFLWFPEAATGGLLSTAATKPLGESTDKWFQPKFALELLSFSFGAAQAETGGSASTGAAAGKASFDEFAIEKFVDLASVPLYEACTAGAHFPTVMLAIRKQGGSPMIYLQYIFRMVFVINIGWGGGGGEEAPKESIKFRYGALGVQYCRQLPTGAPGVPIPQMWSIITNKPTLEVPQLTGTTPSFMPPGM
jgi:type VI protein secretion system component Hcp